MRIQFIQDIIDLLRKKNKNKNIGCNNIINIDNKVNCLYTVEGNNNFIDISSKKTSEPQNLKINIRGSNNRIIIKNLRTANLFIDIGNYTDCNNVEIEILDNFVCAQAHILGYQSNTPIKIGANCLFSKDICIRNGELPHAIYDINTFENFDKSQGIFIGNHVWIGEHAYIMKKSQIQDDSIVGAMSVVTKAFDESNVLIAGNPAKICKRNIMWEEDANKVTSLNSR